MVYGGRGSQGHPSSNILARRRPPRLGTVPRQRDPACRQAAFLFKVRSLRRKRDLNSCCSVHPRAHLSQLQTRRQDVQSVHSQNQSLQSQIVSTDIQVLPRPLLRPCPQAPPTTSRAQTAASVSTPGALAHLKLIQWPSSQGPLGCLSFSFDLIFKPY